ncbi:Cullin-2 [Cichlidogyrus casuarinus]|uniref:Cullin-2 n=1 Tax=Cichlidogyrus casuarinus TaxID=1844966 RepID=A0ABD2PQU7_9PLAT
MEVGLTNWRVHLLDKLKDRLTSCLLSEVHNDRSHAQGRQRFIVPCLKSFLKLSELKDINTIGAEIYTELFEKSLIEQTRAYYSEYAAKCESSLSVNDYVSLKPIEEIFQEVFLNQRLRLLNSSIEQIMFNEKKAALNNMYLLLSPYNLCQDLNSSFNAHVRCLVNTAIKSLPLDASAPSQFVDSLISIRNRFNLFIADVFHNMTSLKSQLDRGFAQAISDNVASSEGELTDTFKPHELLADYVNMVLRSGPAQESQRQERLMNSIIVFKYIEDKHIFQKLYHKMLSQRLIKKNYFSLELEEMAILELKKICGYEYTSKFQQMYYDIQQVSEQNEQFGQNLRDIGKTFAFAQSFKILGQSVWPIRVSPLDAILPRELNGCQEAFHAFYSEKHPKTVLHWVHSQCNIIIQTCFTGSNKYLLAVSNVIAAILMYFEQQDTDELTSSLGVMRQPSIEQFTLMAETKLVLNRDFSCERTKLRLIVGNEAEVEVDSATKQTSEDRRFFVQAAIVRLMKCNKQLTHSQLINAIQTEAGTKFGVPISLIKFSLDTLIEKGYVERSPNDPDLFLYLA